MDVSIIIVNWNSRELLQKCLSSIEFHTAGVRYEVVVIDSGSFDGCGAMIEREFPKVRFIQSPENIGFAKANNLACRSARGRTFLFLNPDTELTCNAVGIMLEHADRCGAAGAVGAKLLNADGTIQTSCIQSFPSIFNQALNTEILRTLFPRSPMWGIAALLGSETAKVDVVSGACLLVSRAAFEQVGRFTEDYFMYAEDVDICCKLHNAGYVNYYVPSAVVLHFGGGSTLSAPSGFSILMMRESRWQYFRKQRGSLYANAYRVSTLLAALARLALLIAVFPLRAIPSRAGMHRNAMRKWLLILAWSMSLKQARFPQ